MKKLLIILTIIAVCFTSYIIGYNSTTTTTNLSLVKPASEDETVDWFNTMNDNMDLIDAIFDTVTLTEYGYLDGVTSAIQTQLDAKTPKTQEEIEDYAGAMFTGNTETGLTITYQDGDGTIDAVIGANDIVQSMLKCVNEPNDEEIFTYESTTGDFEWHTLAELSIQPLDATLTAVAGLTIGANELIYGTGADAFSMLGVNATATNKFLRQVSSGVPAWATLEAGDIPDISATYQPLDTALTNISALAYVSPSFIKMTADDTYAVRTLAETLSDIGAQSTLTNEAGLYAALSDVTDFVQADEANSIDSAMYTDASIDHEHFAPDVISGLADVTSADADYILIWDATDSALKKCDMGEVRGTGGGTVDTSGTPVDNDFAKFTDADTIEGRSYSETMEDLNPITTKTGTATLTVAEAGTVKVSAGSAYTLTLPTAVGHSGLRYHFIKTDCNYNLITLDGNAAETFNYENSTGAPVTTYARLNTYCAEVTIVSDGSNWQVISEALGQVPSVCVESTADILNIKNSIWVYIPLNDEIYDIGSNYNISEWISGSADGTVVNHLQDDGTSPFTAAMVGYRVKNTTDTTYAWITACNDAGDVTISADIFVNGEGYQIMNSKFVAPIAGKYFISASVCFESTVADRRYIAGVHNNAANIRAKAEHAAITEFIYPNVIIQEVLAKNDYIQLTGLHVAGVDTVDVDGGVATYIQVRLISKD